MLDSIEPEKFDEWWALWQLEPWGEDWRQAGIVAAAIDNFRQALTAAMASSEKPYTPDWREPEDYYRPKTGRREAAAARSETLTDEEMRAAARRRAGLV